MFGRIWCVSIVCGFFLVVTGGAAGAEPLDFVAVDWLGRLAHVDPDHGLAAPLRTGLPRDLQALAISPLDGQLYAASRTDLFILDPATGDTTPRFPLGIDVRGMAFSPEGTLYVSAGESSLYTVDLDSHDADLVGHLATGMLAQGLDFSPDGRLFAIGPYGSTPYYQLSEIILDGDTLQQVRIGTGFGRLGQSLAFAPGGALYALGNEIARLDPATGAVMGDIVPLGRDYRGLTIIPEPTALSCLFCVVAAMLLRRGPIRFPSPSRERAG